MIYQIVTTDKFDKSFKKLEKQTQKIIKAWIEKNTINGGIKYNIRLIFERLDYEYIKCRTFDTWIWRQSDI